MSTVLYMSMSLDGYIAGPEDREGQELGRDGGRLFNWPDDRDGPDINRQVYRAAISTAAVISSSRSSGAAASTRGSPSSSATACIRRPTW